MARTESEDTAVSPAGDAVTRHAASEEPSVFVMCAYFLGLASIVVIVIGGHFPWFTLAPLTVLLMFAHVRRLETKFKRDSAHRMLHSKPL